MVEVLEYFFDGGAYKLKISEWIGGKTKDEKILGDYVEVVNNIRENKNNMEYAKVSSGLNERETKSLIFIA